MTRGDAIRLARLVVLVAALAACAARNDANPARAHHSAAAHLALPPMASFQFGDGPPGIGLIADVASQHELPLLTAVVVVEGGARREPVQKAGLASFTAGLLDEGAAGMSRASFLAALDRLGARFAAHGSADDVTLTLSFLARDLDAGLDLLFAATFVPDFPDDAVAKARVRTLGQLVAARDDEESLARQVLYARLFPAHAYGRPVAGEEATVATFTRDDVGAFHQSAFAPARLRVVLAGDVAPEVAVAAIARAASRHGVELGAPRPRSEPPPIASSGGVGQLPSRRTLVLVHKPDVEQPQICFGCRAPLATSADRTALLAANVPFGGGFTSWLVDRLRVDLGLTYDAGSDLAEFAEGSVFAVHSFTRNATVGALLSEAFAQLDRLQRGDLDADALARAKSTLTTDVVQELETTHGVAGLVHESLVLRTGADSVARFGRELDALTLPQLQAAVARHLPRSNQVVCVVVGDRAELEAELARFGPVEVVDARTLAPLAPLAAPPASPPPDGAIHDHGSPP
jgi:zinc protease